jgi:signal transduction histidine kinase
MFLTRVTTGFVRRWRSLPPRTIRLRLTMIYGSLFIVTGAALLAITYGLVSHQYTTGFFVSNGQQGGRLAAQVGAAPIPGRGSVEVQRSGTVGPVLLNQTAVPGGSPAGGSAAGGPGSVASGPIQGPISPKGLLPPPQVFAAIARQQSSAARGTLLIESGVALAIMALIATWLGWVVAGRALRPLRAITSAARDISASSLHRRIALEGPDDELKQLGNTFDALLERLESAFATQRQFAANVSHELRTPLTFERTTLEVALADPNANAETLRVACEQVLDAGERQERLIDALLMLSRSQRGLERREPVDLAAIAAQALAGAEYSGLTVDQALEPAQTTGDPGLVERLAANLIGNAIVHNRPGGRVSVRTRTTVSHATLEVTNTGPPIAQDDLDRLFEPFQRLDGPRISSHRLGLGLSIVRAIAEAHGATVETSLRAGGGLSIEVAFPAAQPYHAETAALAPSRSC